jgi:uncharacterized protein YukE
MTVLGLGHVEAPSEVTGSFRAGWIRHIRVVLGSAGGAALIFGAFELIQKQPGESFKLLGAWGPWPVVALVALVLVGSFLSRINETISTTFAAIVTSSQQQAQSSGKMADAVSRLADQGNKQAQEMQRLAIYAAQEFPGVYERLDRQDKVLDGHGKTLGEIAEAIRHLAARGKHGD